MLVDHACEAKPLHARRSRAEPFTAITPPRRDPAAQAWYERVVSKLSSLSTISEKLRSPTPDVRIVALIHARAHGAAARALAAEITQMLEDEQGAVQWHAMSAIMKVAHGAEDAVPIAQAQLAKGAPPMLVSRALATLRAIGPVAERAKPNVMRIFETSDDGSRRADALETLVAIAPGDDDVRRLLLEALYRADYATSSRANRSLESAPEALIDHVADEVRTRGTAGTQGERLACAIILATLASKQPQLVRDFVPSLLEGLDEPCVSSALFAIGNLPRAFAVDLLDHVARVVAEGDLAASESAIEQLDRMDGGARTLPVLVQKLDQHMAAPPVGGQHGGAARVFAAAAKVIAETPGAPSEPVVAKVTEWLRAMISRTWENGEGPSWYTVRAVALAAAKMSPASADLGNVLFDLAAESRKWLESDESGVMDFERALREALCVMGDPPDLWNRFETLGIGRDQASDQPEEEDDLPDYPPEVAAPKPRALKASPVPANQRRSLDEAVSRGETLVELGPGASPKEAVTAVDRTIA
jgi:hypothetical protein